MRNEVVLSGREVVKTFPDGISLGCERNAYEALSGSGAAPRLLRAQGRSVTLERVPGETLRRLTRRGGIGADELSEKLFGLYDAMQASYCERTGGFLVHGDLSPGNLIMKGGAFSVIDFERSRAGAAEESLAEPVALLLSLSFGEEDAARAAEGLAAALCARFGADEELLRQKTESERKRIALRRSVMPAIRRSDCVILAGGRAKRMGGADKGALTLGGHSFAEHVIYNTRVFDRVYLSVREGGKDSGGLTELVDIIPGIGPLGALYTALSVCPGEQIFTIPCDMPIVSEKTVLGMFALLSEDADAVVLRGGGRIFPTVGVYKKSALEAVREQAESGDHAMRGALSRLRVRYFTPEDDKELMNVNTPEELAALMRE